MLSVVAAIEPRPRRCPICSATRVLADFSGYYPGYSDKLAAEPQRA